MYEINSEAMIFGFMLGDGWISYSKNDRQEVLQCGFSGDEESLINVKEDLIRLYGDIGTARINTRVTQSLKYGIIGTTTSMVVNMKICKRYIELGMPIGKRIEQEFLIPDWIMNGSNETKASFLSGLYSAEGFTPAMQKNDKTPKVLGLNMSKRLVLKDNFDIFIGQLEQILNDLSIQYSKTEIETFTCDKNIKTTLTFTNSNENILTIAKTLDLRYCIHKKEKLEILEKYTEEKNKVLKILNNAYEEAMDRSNTAQSIADKYKITRSQVEKWRARRTGVRIPNSFPTLTEFKQSYSPL